MLIDKYNASDLTPMMSEYLTLKKEYRDTILFYRLGDFYEMFFDDAILASKELELVLTGRDAGLDEKIPMAGVPHHSSKIYINKLVNKGYKVAIVEQMEDPALAKGIVKRSIVNIISPGTILDNDNSDIKNNFLVAIYTVDSSYGISYADISTGEFKTTEILNDGNNKKFIDFLVKLDPREIILNKKIDDKIFNNFVEINNIYLSYVNNPNTNLNTNLKYINSKIKNFSSNKFKNKIFSINSITILLEYIYLFKDYNLSHLDNIEYIHNENFMKIDAHTRENLEIHKNLTDNSTKNSLFEVLDYTNTPMGSRKINSWLEFPLINIEDIKSRLDKVEYLFDNRNISDTLSNYLDKIYDIERILSKISYRNANAKDLLMLRNSIEILPKIKSLINTIEDERFYSYKDKLDDLCDIYKLINNSIKEDSPNNITEGNIIKEGYNESLDKIKYNSKNGKKLLLDYELEQKNLTNIPKLKISYNKNVGYFIEITNSYLDRVPENYIRRQTLKNSERYITPRLNEISDMILGSQNEIIELEYEIFVYIREKISNNSNRIKSTADMISELDALNSLAKVANENNYTRPKFNDNNYIEIKDGRHPVIEKSLNLNEFIPNDTSIGLDNKIIQIITGPNMAGKSTYMRQVAIIILMSHIGSFVPANYADICIIKSLFTRIGASDNLAKGESTFMVEMNEMSNIIKYADKDSFLILDEVGRGTSTNDGYSIAKAILEYISLHNKSKTLFATHYHELTELENKLDNVENFKIDISEKNGDIIFLRKIVKGFANKSYGIEVAKLSGLPEEIIYRANQILKNTDYILTENEQLNFVNFESSRNEMQKDIIINEINSVDLNNMTPIQAIEFVNKLKRLSEDIDND